MITVEQAISRVLARYASKDKWRFGLFEFVYDVRNELGKPITEGSIMRIMRRHRANPLNQLIAVCFDRNRSIYQVCGG